MINLFSPGGVPSPDSLMRDDLRFEELQRLHERKLHDYFGEGEIPNDIEQLFIAFAEIYFSEDHLDNVAVYYDYCGWDFMKDDILGKAFSVPDINTPAGINEARRILLEDQL